MTTVASTAVLFDSETLGRVTLPLAGPAQTALDPLSLITALPPHMVTAKVAASRNMCVIESELGELPGDFDVLCTVTEKPLPSGYHADRVVSQAVTVSGATRAMDERFQTDLAKCLHLKAALARELIDEVVVPRIDKGDPPPVWIERARAAGHTETTSERRALHARELERRS